MRLSINKVNAVARNLGLILLVVMSIYACSNTSSDDVGNASEVDLGKISVSTTTNLIKDWVENVGGDRVDVMSIIPHDSDPHTFKPTPKNMKDIEESSLFILIGSQYEESWVQDAVSNTNQRAIELSVEIWEELVAIADREFGEHEDHDDHDKEHDDHAGHDHGDHGYDLHFWHDPTKVVSAIDVISNILVEMDPDNAEYFQSNATRYKQELIDIDKWISSEVKNIPAEKRVLITNHRTMGYFAERYDFEILGSVIPSFSSDEEPSPKDVANILDIIEEHKVNVIFGELQMRDKLATAIASDTGIRVATLHSETLGSEGSDTATYIDMIKVNVGIIVDNLSN